MAKQTSTQTYRVSDEVDAELRRLAKIHGGVDRALRVLMEMESPIAFMAPVERVSVAELAARPNQEFSVHLDATGPELSSGKGTVPSRAGRQPLLKPSEKKN